MSQVQATLEEGVGRPQLKSYFEHPPPQYAEATSPRNSQISERSLAHSATKITETVTYNQGPWLLRRTSIVIESEPSDLYPDDKSTSRASGTTSRISEHTRRSTLNRKISYKNGQENLDVGQHPWHANKHFDTGFGVKVSIEAGKPNRGRGERRHDMKGLEQAASVKRWAGGGRPGEAWGKLMKDPELWDPSGDTYVFFGHQRPQPSFRVRSKMLEDVGSEILTTKLQQGRRRPRKPTSISNSSTFSATRGMQSLSLKRTDTSTSETSTDLDDPSIRYEIHFPAPSDSSRTDMLRYHITTRNFFALLLARPLVGLTFYQALMDLNERIRLYMPGDPNCALIIIKCLMENNLHNVCNDPAAAAGLLAWSEDEEVCWQEGWREGFVHCSGMYAQLQNLPEFRDVSHTSRALLERAHLERQVRLQEAEDRLTNFEFDDIWPDNTDRGSLRTVRSSFDHVRRFMRSFYERQYKYWPPRGGPRTEDGTWLTRSLVSRLQEDCNALYDHFVDKSIVWTTAKSASGPITRNGPSTAISSTDTDYFLAEAFKRFDQRYKYPHIPCPYPLFPASLSGGDVKQQKTGLFGSKTKSAEKRIAHSYTEASNLPTLRKATDFASNAFVEAFVHFEKTDRVLEIEPIAARKGRWMLLYGMLQALSRVSVDTPDLYFADDVTYFLNPRLKGTPPWSYGSGIVYEEAEPRMAHVWRDFPQ